MKRAFVPSEKTRLLAFCGRPEGHRIPTDPHAMADNRDKLQDFIDAFTEEIKLLDASGT